MSVLSGSLRGIGHSFVPMLIYIVGLCVIRVLWVLFVFPVWTSPIGLMTCYPVSWLATALALAVTRLIAEKKLKLLKREAGASL